MALPALNCSTSRCVPVGVHHSAVQRPLIPNPSPPEYRREKGARSIKVLFGNSTRPKKNSSPSPCTRGEGDGGEGQDRVEALKLEHFYETCLHTAGDTFSPLIPNPSPPEYRREKGAIDQGGDWKLEPGQRKIAPPRPVLGERGMGGEGQDCAGSVEIGAFL